ncbi:MULTISPECIES: SIR2 family protein [unclassified Luteibacter]|uniref:SIR2 family protein n=1 Tax=Luteibacter sp. PvP019 TaxID=3156436 RepID=UPI003394F7C2
MIAWGDALVKELAARRVIIFFGAGASASCVSPNTNVKPPNWKALLEMLNARNGDEDSKAVAAGLIAERRYLDAAEVIVSSLNEADYHDEMRRIFELPRYEKSRIHEAILSIDPKVAITTNFDTVYDTYCRSGAAAEGYNVFKYTDTHLVSQLRSPIRCVVKAHGCITTPERMVLTRTDFFRARQDAAHFYKTLDALFLTHTILFIGYNLDDPDIQMVLENANIAAPSSHKHYFVCAAGTPDAVKRSKSASYNLHFHEFAQGDYDDLEESLMALAERVGAYRELNPAV